MKLHETPVKKDEKMKVGFSSEQEKWQKVEEAFRLAYQQHSSSTLAPMFLAYQAMALVNLQKLDEAITTMKSAIKAMKSGAIKSFYEVTLSLMQIDSKNKLSKKQG